MFEMITRNSILDRFDEFDDLFKSMNVMFNDVFGNEKKSNGLRIINRPHNLYTYKDENGKVTGNKLEVCTTPFKKDEVSVEISNNILTVKCGTENKHDEDTKSCVYHGISSQSYEFSIKLSDKVDQDKVEAKNEDGILTIKIPFKMDAQEGVRKITVL